ncbi:MAG: helix-turn-helix transcriptional regulator [Paenisporosarcina sp.]
MQIGSLIKYHRTKQKMTQSELAEGICSVPHLSKIENNSKEANIETIRLVLDRLEINLQDVEESEVKVEALLNQLLQNMLYLETEKAENTYRELQAYKEMAPFTKHIYLHEIYKLRYYLFTKDLEIADEQIKWLNAQRQNFSQHEGYLLSYFTGIFLILRGKYEEADEKISAILQEYYETNTFEGEIYYHLALVKGYMYQSGHAINYGKKALNFFKDQFNFKRILHVQMSLAINYSQSKIYDEALDNYQHLVRNTEMLKETALLPHIYHNMGDLRHRMGDYEQALHYFKKSAVIFQERTENYLLCLYNLALTEFKLEKWDDSKISFTLLNKEAKEMKVSPYQLYSSYYLFLLNDKKQKAMTFLEEKILPSIEKADEQKEFYRYFSKILAEYYKNEGKYEKAVKYIL